MKSKTQRHVQPRESVLHRKEQVSEEIRIFLGALDSYPDRAAAKPGISFRRYLSSLFKASSKHISNRH
jgi:hypothetical protein